MNIELTECCVGVKRPVSPSTTGVHSVLGILWERSGHAGKNAECFRVNMPTYLAGRVYLRWKENSEDFGKYL